MCEKDKAHTPLEVVMLVLFLMMMTMCIYKVFFVKSNATIATQTDDECPLLRVVLHPDESLDVAQST